MTSLHKLIALAIIWIVIGGVLAVFFIGNVALYRIDNAMMVIVTILVLAAAVTATYLVTQSPDQEKYKA